MKKITYFCDLCKEQIVDNEVSSIKEMDFCPGCYEELADEISIYIAKVEKEHSDTIKAEKRAAAAKASRKKQDDSGIDAGKAQALRDAGWTAEQIAEEMKTTPEEISKITTAPAKKRKRAHEWA